MRKSVVNTIHTMALVAVFHVVALVAIYLYYFSWPGLLIGFTYWFVANCPGVGVCFHRLLTHQGYEVPKWLEYTLTVFGCLALQGSPIRWVVTHRIHHQYSDQKGLDPHTPRDGLAWSQWFWIMFVNPSQDKATLEKYAPKLMKDKFHLTLHYLWWLPSLMVGAALLAIAWPNPSWILLGVVAPVAIGWEITWLVNSLGHYWGSQRFKTGDDSTNNFWLALPTFGEAWHNNHHKYPWSARHGLGEGEVDINYMVIRLFEKLGLAQNIKTAELK